MKQYECIIYIIVGYIVFTLIIILGISMKNKTLSDSISCINSINCCNTTSYCTDTMYIENNNTCYSTLEYHPDKPTNKGDIQ